MTKARIWMILVLTTRIILTSEFKDEILLARVVFVIQYEDPALVRPFQLPVDFRSVEWVGLNLGRGYVTEIFPVWRKEEKLARDLI